MTRSPVADSTHQQLVRWRHELHQIPETAFTEHDTSAYLATQLRRLGFEVTTGVGGTGVVASLTRGTSTRAIGLRADMDALPLIEQGTHQHVSRRPGVMHACGHDGHMAMLLGAAAALAHHGTFDGTVRAIFQPAEEPGRGARAMIDDGLLDRFPIDAMFGLHNLPGVPAGHLHVRPGPIMAGEDNFHIHVRGRGGHASAPHLVTDPIVIGAQIVTALQTIVARDIDPVATAVLSCTDFRTDGARNAIPSNVHITGDTRTFDPAVSQRLEQRIRELSNSIAAAHGASCDVTYTREFAPTINDPQSAAVAASAATAALPRNHVNSPCQPIMASEDFGVFAHHVPAAFAFLGNGTEPGAGGTPLHSSDYDINDDILPVGVAYYVRLVHDLL